MSDGRLYRAIWRWHFYAGLFVLPFVLILSVTGAIYLFKPQIDRWEERNYRDLGTQGAVTADQQATAALASVPGGRLQYYRLPEHGGDAAMIQVGLADGTPRQVFVSPQGRVLGSVDRDARISETVSRIHGSLLLGTWGDVLVELAASWTIVMILTGAYLWWPRAAGMAGTFWPRLGLRGRPLLKDVHRVTGFWIAGLVLVMLASGLPWAGTWGGLFKWARTELGLIDGPQAWKVGAEATHAHNPAALAVADSGGVANGLPLAAFVARAEREHMAFPVIVLPPHAPQRFGPPTGNVWTAKSEAQNRRLDREVTYDPLTGAEVQRSGFADQHPIDRVVNTAIAWHEGQLFGLANQLIGVATALALIATSIFGVWMWLKRRPQAGLGAPPFVAMGRQPWLVGGIAVLAVLLPLFGLSLIVVLLAELVLRRRFKRLATWMDFESKSA